MVGSALENCSFVGSCCFSAKFKPMAEGLFGQEQLIGQATVNS